MKKAFRRTGRLAGAGIGLAGIIGATAGILLHEGRHLACTQALYRDKDTVKAKKTYEATIPYADTLATPVHPAPVKSRTARYLDSMGFIHIAEADSSIAIDLMYTHADNFTGEVLYEDLKEAYLHPEAMKSLSEAQRFLKEQHPGYSLIVYDAARPMSVQQKMWNVVKGTSKYIYVSNPSRGGGLHNYGLAVDVSILDDKGVSLPMGTPVDHLGKEAHTTEEARLVAQGKITEQERKNRLLLRQIMKEAGFRPLPSEWWHFNRVSRQTAKERYRVIP